MFRHALSTTIPYVPVLADVWSGAPDWAFWINYGACGLILGWTLFRAEPRLTDIARAIDRLTRMIGLLLSELPHVIEQVKRQAVSINRESDDSARARGDKTGNES